MFGGVWIWFTVLQAQYINHPPGKLDWTDGHKFAVGFTLYLLFQICYFVRYIPSLVSFPFCNLLPSRAAELTFSSSLVPFLLSPVHIQPSCPHLQLIQNFLYYTISSLAREDHELIRLSSFLRGLESAGSACGFGISSRKSLSYYVPLGINVRSLPLPPSPPSRRERAS